MTKGDKGNAVCIPPRVDCKPILFSYNRLKLFIGGDMQNTTQYAPCPQCGSTNAAKVKYTWWGGALGPAMFTHVKCNNCGTQYNGKTGKSNQNSIIIYVLTTFVLGFCICGGIAVLSFFLNN